MNKPNNMSAGEKCYKKINENTGTEVMRVDGILTSVSSLCSIDIVEVSRKENIPTLGYPDS